MCLVREDAARKHEIEFLSEADLFRSGENIAVHDVSMRLEEAGGDRIAAARLIEQDPRGMDDVGVWCRLDPPSEVLKEFLRRRDLVELEESRSHGCGRRRA